MRIILMGTSSWVIPIFDRMANEHDVVGVFTRAPKPVGRKQILTQSPVHIWAESHNIPVYTKISDFGFLISDLDKKNHNSEIRNQKSIDAIIVASYGVILKDNVLNAARLGCINVHPSLLPAYRGPAPMATSIYNGDTESGICIMQVTAEVDAGDIYMCRKFPIGENDTNADVESRVGNMAAEMLSEFLAAPEKYPPQKQTGEPTFTRKWTGDDELIDWTRTPREIHNQVRAIGGRTKINGLDVKILETRINDVGANCIRPTNTVGVCDTPLQITRVQPAGKNPMPWRDFVNGQRGKIEFGERPTEKENK